MEGTSLPSASFSDPAFFYLLDWREEKVKMETEMEPLRIQLGGALASAVQSPDHQSPLSPDGLWQSRAPDF